MSVERILECILKTVKASSEVVEERDTIHPGFVAENFMDVIEALGDAPQFVALSYEWGSSEKTHNIQLEDGSTVRITDSLYHALRDLRDIDLSQEYRVIWADGICINQNDLKERQQQVSVMGEIYRNAAQVITYIGAEKNNSNSAIDFACELLQYYYQNGDRDPRRHLVEEHSNIGLPPSSDSRWAALKALLLRRWSARCWCAQEFLQNTQLTMMCGRKTIPNCFLLPDLVQLSFNRSLPAFVLPPLTEDPNSLKECLATLGIMRRRMVSNKQQATLYRLLVAFHRFQATDRRDKVYCLLGLASDRQDMSLMVDYTLTNEQLYIKQFGSHGMAFGYHYTAGGNSKPDLRIDTVDNSLTIAGCLVDRIVRLSGRIEPYYHDQSGSRSSERIKWLKEQMQLIQELEPYPNGSNIRNVFWKTLIGNITLDQREAQDEYETYFDAHLNFKEDKSVRQKDMAREFCDAVRRRARYRCLAATEKGYFGAVPETAEIGDWVFGIDNQM
ncbi:hypothetical protein IFR05_015018 [Cadophora sp. M221]|nr:hypothetical protein IFR05_015018 [Cadophora sp. M221]